MPTLTRWISTWHDLGAIDMPRVAREYESLLARYSEPHRKYHTVRHLDECFEKLGELRDLAEHPAEVELALWYHDAIHEKRASQNEARSAELAAAVAHSVGLSAECTERTVALIMATRHAAVPEGIDAQVVVDVDLSILSAPPERFDEYERQVREEYSWVPGFLFRQERRKILAELLARASIYGTPRFRERYEARARANIERSLAALG